MFKLIYQSYNLVKKILSIIWPNSTGIKLRLISFGMLHLISTLTKSFLPLIIYNSVNRSLDSENNLDPVQLAFYLGTYWTVDQIIMHSKNWLYFYLFDDTCHIVSNKLVDSIIEMSYEERTDQSNIAQINTAVFRLDRTLHTFLQSGVLNIVTCFTSITISSIIVQSLYGLKYSSSLFLSFLPFSYFTKHELPKWEDINKDFLKKRKNAENEVFDKLSKVQLIDELGVKNMTISELHKLYDLKRLACYNLAFTTNKIIIGQTVVLGAFLIGSCQYLAYENTENSNVFEISKLLSILIQVYSEISNIGITSTQIIGRYIPVLNEILDLINNKPKVILNDDNNDEIKINNLQRFELPKVVCNNVSFSYSNHQNVLDDLSLTIEAGKRTALIGPSGQGKSTFAHLLLGIDTNYKGEIAIFDESIGKTKLDIKNISRDCIRSNVGYISQKPVLFNCSILENLTYGLQEYSLDEVQHTIRICGLENLISKLPNGINTIVGDKGCDFSGGEKQLLAIARVILRNPSIFILDEPTSSIDAINFNLIQEILDQITSGKTTFLITHNLQFAAKLDIIYVIDGGKIIESGAHKELLSKNGTYAEMFNLQRKPLVINSSFWQSPESRIDQSLNNNSTTAYTSMEM